MLVNPWVVRRAQLVQNRLRDVGHLCPLVGELASERKEGLRSWLNARVNHSRPFRGGMFAIRGLYQLGNLNLKIINARLQTLCGTTVQLLFMR